MCGSFQDVPGRAAGGPILQKASKFAAGWLYSLGSVFVSSKSVGQTLRALVMHL